MDEQIVAKVARAVSFMQIIEPLKSATRTAWTQTGRRESVAEHSWRLAMLGLLVSLQNQHLDGGCFRGCKTGRRAKARTGI